MKRVGQIMSELGFNKEASDGVKEAFIKHLLRASENVHVATPTERREVERFPDRVHPLLKPQPPEQLSFDFDSTGTEGGRTKPK